MDKTAVDKKKTKLQNWSEIGLGRQASGLTVKQWCRRENMNPSPYYSMEIGECRKLFTMKSVLFGLGMLWLNLCSVNGEVNDEK